MAGHRAVHRDGIDISDGDLTASDLDIEIATIPNPRKRKSPDADDDVIVKDEWSDDSDGAYEKLKKKPKRASTRGKRKSRTVTLSERVGDVDESSALENDFTDPTIPDYFRKRRQEFDNKRAILKEAGLKLPPDYTDIYFSDDERISGLEEKPKFGDSIKPSRKYEDVCMEISAGIIPASIAQYLRDYQVVGVRFLHQLFVYQRGGILGDDMGLGKTVQVAAFLTAAFGKTGDERDAKRMRKMRRQGGNDIWYPRILIVCPGSVIENWRHELDRWGWWHVGVFHGPSKDDVLQTARAGRYEIVVTTYTTYKTNREKINTIQWDAVVADECHILKEVTSETTKAMNQVNALCRIGLTGTAIQNKYEELWTLLNWTNPGHFGSMGEWRETICKPLTVGQSHDATLFQLSLARKTAKKLVANLLPQFFLRRMKSLIAHQLPNKSDKVVFCPLTDIQRDAYENFLDSPLVRFILGVSEDCDCGSGKKSGWCCHTFLPNGKPWKAFIFPAIMTMAKLSSHLILLIPSGKTEKTQENELQTLEACLPHDWETLYKTRKSIRNMSNPEFCGKWKILRRLLRFWHENGDKVLVFSHSVRLLRILQHLFHNTSYSVSYLDGSLSYEERQRVVDDFNGDPNQFVFLISTKAGGVGLNITSANKVVIFDPHWNPSHDLQAQDRAYRIGQARDVDVFRLISAGTIEEIMYARQIYKQQQANIGYNASSERRYFKGVQHGSKGEIFGLQNMFTFHGDQVLLREIVNKTNIAEAKAGVNLTDIDLEDAAAEDDPVNHLVKKEDADGDGDGGLSQLADLLTAENQDEVLAARLAARPRSHAVQAILASAGVEYTHENSEVVGSSKVEAQLSRRAEAAAAGSDDDETNPLGAGGGGEGGGGAVNPTEGNSALFADSQANSVPMTTAGRGFRLCYNPPEEVMRRQFCSMAREFGFASATEFALVVESWTQEQRRNCLDSFYKAREASLLVKKDEESEDDVKVKREVYDDDEETEDEVVKNDEDSREDVKIKKEVVDENENAEGDESSRKEGVGAGHDEAMGETEEAPPTLRPLLGGTETRDGDVRGGKKPIVVVYGDDDETDDEL